MCFVKDIPENHEISSKAILDFIDETENDSNVNLTNFMLLSDKYILAQFCKKLYDANDIQLLYSMTKSFSSLGIGIAADKGFLDLDDKVISFFPEKLPENISENLNKMTLRHLLTMTSGIHENTYGALYPQKDWVKAFLAQDFSHEPGTFYRYSTHASHMLSAIVEKSTGQNLLDFLYNYLFSPLNISKPQWEISPEGIIAGGMGLCLSPVSIAKIGLLLLNKGMFLGKCIISSKYINLATSAQVIKQDESNNSCKKYSGYQYGYQFHIGFDNCFSAVGSFGQLCFISPKKNIIIVATSRNTNTETLLRLIHKHFIEYCNKTNIHNDEDYDKLQDKLAALEYDVPVSCEIPDGIPTLNNNCYIVDKNPNGVQKIILNQDKNTLDLEVVYSNEITSKLQFDFMHPICDKSIFVKDVQLHLQRYISYAVWLSSSVLELTVIYTETPYVVTYKLSFLDNNISINFMMNVSLNIKNFTATGFLTQLA